MVDDFLVDVVEDFVDLSVVFGFLVVDFVGVVVVDIVGVALVVFEKLELFVKFVKFVVFVKFDVAGVVVEGRVMRLA